MFASRKEGCYGEGNLEIADEEDRVRGPGRG
jgi:hypothetical protein